MTVRRSAAVLLAFASAALLAACESSPKGDAHSAEQEARGRQTAALSTDPASKPINTVCPIGGHGADEMIPVAYKGKTIGFCCGGCVDEFTTMNAAQKDQVLARAEKNVGPE